MRSRFSLTSLALVLVLAAVACGVAPNRRISRDTPTAVVFGSAVTRAGQAMCSTAAGSQTLTTGSHASTISNAYQTILRLFIHPLDSPTLLNAAWQGAVGEAAKEGVNDPGVPAPQITDSAADAAWQTFAASYDQLSKATDGHVDQTKMAFEAIKKMADSVNEGHTYFVDPESYAQQGREQVLSGGIGVVLNGKQAPFVVEEVVAGAPADQAGVRPGDSIVSVNGCDISDWDSLQLTSHVRGEAGKPVHLGFNRPTTGNYEVDITRARVTFPDITSTMLPQGVGYIHLHQFSSPTAVLSTTGKPLIQSLTEILSSFQAQGARGWVLDLRGNPGGEVPTVQAVGGLILQPGAVFSTVDRAGHKVQSRTTGNRDTNPPLLAVLVDKGSASGAEILASAVQDENVAPVIGTQTAGVANEAQLVGIGDGAGISVTIAQTYSPSGRPLNGEGLVPDIQVERTATDLVAGIDPPLDRALQVPGPDRAVQTGSGQ